jgi:hypothetical protein
MMVTLAVQQPGKVPYHRTCDQVDVAGGVDLGGTVEAAEHWHLRFRATVSGNPVAKSPSNC